MTKLFTSVKAFVLAHNVLSGFGLLLLLWGGYYMHGKLTSTAGETRYVLATAQMGTIIQTVTGSGQVSASNQLDLKPKVSGDVLSLPVAEGSTVEAGQIIAKLDPTDAQKSARDAEVSLESAKLSLQKMLQPADALSLTQSQNALDRANTSKQNAEDDLAKTYDNSFNSISNAFLDLPSIVSGLHDLLFTPSSQLGGINVNNIDYYSSSAAIYDMRGTSYGTDASNKYQIALDKYNKNFADYKTLDRNADKAAIEATLAETYDTTLAIADAVKSANNLIQFFEDQMTQHNQHIPTLANTQLSSLNTYTGTVNSHLNDLLSMQNTIKTDKNTIVDADRTITENTQSLAKLKSGADPLDIQTQQLAVTQRENALIDAQNTLADYTVRAPFPGTLSKINVNVGDSAGGGTAIGTLIAKQQIAELSMNEVDAAKLAVGQKASLTFDAIDGLTITGHVASVDTAGTVSQGVVTYTVKISFDTQDARVKPGMSVNATIETAVKTDVLTIPASAVKTQGNIHYVQMFDTPLANSGGNQGVPSTITPRQQIVEVGLSDDNSTEITSGLKEGDQIVTRAITGAGAAQSSQTAPSILPTGGRGVGGGAFRGG